MSRRYSFGGDRARSVLLAVVIVASTVIGAAGPALAQTATDTGPISYSYTDSPETLVIDTSALDGGTEFTVEFTTQGGPSTGTTVLARETYNTANIDRDKLILFNEGAYDTVNVTVSGYSGGEPTFDTRAVGSPNIVQDLEGIVYTVVGTTGGDSDLTCDATDKIGTIVRGVKNLDCAPQPGSETVTTEGLNSEQVELNIYQAAHNTKAANDNQQTVLENYLSDTKTQARIIGKNAYIRALNNGESEASAKASARSAVADYYTVKSKNLVSRYKASVYQFQYLHGIAKNNSGVNNTFVNAGGTQQSINGYGTATVTYPNDTTASIPTVQVGNEWGSGTVSLKTGKKSVGGITIRGFRAEAPTSDYSKVRFASFERMNSLFSEIESQNTNVQNDMDMLVNNTYSSYQSGEINNSDLMDPYVLSTQYSAGNSRQAWVASQLTLLGTNSPENLDQIGTFNVTNEDTGQSYRGVLFSQENPASGSFENGTTYNAADINGTQYISTSDQLVELTGNFTVTKITNFRGERIQNATIEDTDYQTNNVTELKQQYEDLQQKYAEIEARQKNLQGSAGGGLLAGSSSSLVIGLVAVAALYAVSQRRSGGKY